MCIQTFCVVNNMPFLFFMYRTQSFWQLTVLLLPKHFLRDMWLLGDPLLGFPLFARISSTTLVLHPNFFLLPSHFGLQYLMTCVVAFQVYYYLHVATNCDIDGFAVNFVLCHPSGSPQPFELWIAIMDLCYVGKDIWVYMDNYPNPLLSDLVLAIFPSRKGPEVR